MPTNLTTPGAVITTIQPPAPAAPASLEDLGIPHHMQDKRGFCGAACMMMLLGFQGKETSQGELMRRIKLQRDKNRNKIGAGEKPASDRVAWHASPGEIASVLSSLMEKENPWCTDSNKDSQTIMAGIDAALTSGFGAIALVWSATLDTRLPHWVVVSGRTPEVTSKAGTGYWILDPTAAGRADGALRYESLKHKLIRGADLCLCQCWKDSHGSEQTAQRIWVSNDKFEEMLDDGAVKGNGLRYAIVPGAVGKSGGEGDTKSRGGLSRSCRSNLSTTVEEKIAAKKTEAEAEIFASKFKTLTVTIREPDGSLPIER